LNTEAADAHARAREATENDQPTPKPDPDLLGRLTHALGFDTRGVVPKYWIASDAPVIVSKWQIDLGLTPDEIVEVAKGNMRAHGSPANGPRILTRHMQDFAAAKAMSLSPSDDQTPRARSTTHLWRLDDEVMKKFNDDGSYRK
jgi:hypothetical protein